MSWQSETRAWAVASAIVLCFSAIGYKVLKVPVIPDLSATVERVNSTLDIINKPCKGKDCGTLANVDKLIVKVGDIAVDTQTQVKQTGVLINAASASLASTSESVNAQLGHLGPLLDSARNAADSIPAAIQHVNTAVDGIAPLLADSDGAVGDFRRFLTAPALTSTLANVDSMTGSWSGISADGRKVTDKMTADYLKPVPWYLWPMKRSGELLDVGAAIARHAP